MVCFEAACAGTDDATCPTEAAPSDFSVPSELLTNVFSREVSLGPFACCWVRLLAELVEAPMKLSSIASVRL